MMKYYLVLCMLLCSQLAGAEAKPVDSAELPGIPAGIRIGMSIGELRKLRPKAEPFDLAVALGEKPPPKPDDLLKGTHVLLEKIERGAIQSAAGYGFKDGRCVRFSLEDEYAREDFIRKRTEMIRRLVELFGDKYERHLARKGFKGCAYLAPVFVWKGKQRTVALHVTSEYPGVTLERGLIHLAAWGSDEMGIGTVFVTDAEPSLVTTLFAPLEQAKAAYK